VRLASGATERQIDKQDRILLTSWSKYIIKFKTLKVWTPIEGAAPSVEKKQEKGSLLVVGVSGLLKIICLSKI
jgi:hypothetical protein